MTSIHASIPSNMKAAVIEARQRGEQSSTATLEDPGQTIVHEDVESEDEEDNSKENDASLSPSPVDPCPPSSIRRPTVLGKRPLGELPTPEESPSEDEDETTMTKSERNIIANTPNLSSNMANLSFEATFSMPELGTCSRQVPKLVQERSKNIQPPLFTRYGESSSRIQSCSDHFASRAKRICPDEGKENAKDSEEVQPLAAQPKPAPLIGLGVKGGSISAPVSRKTSAVATARPKAKPRVGIRRL